MKPVTSPIEKIIRSRGSQPSSAETPVIEDGETYRPFLIDGHPRMSFTIFHYSRQGFLTRHDFYFHDVRGRVLREQSNGVTLSFNADGNVVTMRGGVGLHHVAEALGDCTLQNIYVHDPRVWPDVDPEIELIDRIAIDSINMPMKDFNDTQLIEH